CIYFTREQGRSRDNTIIGYEWFESKRHEYYNRIKSRRTSRR
ncbi:MAG: hypothetical protein ACJAXH_003234, partial [Colwellia sp.]